VLCYRDGFWYFGSPYIGALTSYVRGDSCNSHVVTIALIMPKSHDQGALSGQAGIMIER
jgi:hypothetical protein